MKVKEFIKELQKFDSELEVILTDGYNCIVYTTKNIEFQKFEDDFGEVFLDIGIGGNEKGE